MTISNPALEARLRRFFKSLNRGMLVLWRLGLGPWLNLWPTVGGRYLVLTTVGRKSGQLRRTPLNYAEVDGAIYCVAGFGGISDWYRNIQANPQIEVWLPTGWWAGEAEDVTGGERHLELVRAALGGSGFVAPLMGLDPRRMSDTALAAATANYRLVRIGRTRERTGPGGPGEQAWIWPLASHVLAAAVVLLQARRRRS